MSFFNESYYLAHNADVRLAVQQGVYTSGLQHYQLSGGKELRDPSANFDASYYVNSNPDVQLAISQGRVNTPLEHFDLPGVTENRAPTREFAGFNATRYLSENADVVAGISGGYFKSALDHYLQCGAGECRAAYSVGGVEMTALTTTGSIERVPYFSESYYLSHNADVQLAVSQGVYRTGLQHYQLSGGKELRSPSENFDAAFYVATYSDVRAAVASGYYNTPLDHFIQFGVTENRAPTGAMMSFDAARYLTENADVQAAITAGGFRSALDHYLQFGSTESRPAYSLSGNTFVGADDTFALTSGAGSVNEGSTVTFTLQTTNVAVGARYNYTISGVSAADVQGGLLTGTVTIGAGGVATIPVTLVNDAATEGAETMTVTIAGRTATSVVNDTSTGSGGGGGGGGGGGSGQTFTLTAAADNFVGGSGDDTFTGTYADSVGSPTFSSSDVISGSGGTDTLNLTHSGLNTTFTMVDALWTGVSGIEAVTFSNSGDGAQTITTGTAFNNAFAAAGVNLTSTTTGAGAIDLTMTTFGGAATITAGTLAGAQTIITGSGASTVSATSGAGALTINGVGLTSVTATTTGAGSQTIGNGSGGGGNLVTVNATAASGNQTITSTSASAVTVTATSGSGATTVTTGAGNDTITLIATSTTGANVITGNGGADTITLASVNPGTDTIVESNGHSVAATAHTLTAAIAAGQTITFGNGLDKVVNFGTATDLMDVTTASSLTAGLGGSGTAFAAGNIYLSGAFSGGVFTVAANGAGADTLILDTASVADQTVATADNWVLLVGVNSNTLTAAMFI